MADDAPRRCYYEILSLDRKCDDDEIRRAYKKAALRCHPDRNHGNEEAAALEFKEVQNAYTVLIDPDERAWYDNHREAILRGDDGGTCAPDELNVFDYFSAKVYDTFSDDDKKGFFNVYRKVFETLVKEESDYNDKFAKTAPSFGDSKSPWSQVSQFYNFWKHFITNKTFAWKDEHKLNEIPDRWTRREAERVNMKVRAQARKEYISAVTQLAHHIYIRDPRVAAEKERDEAEKAEKLAEREKREAEAAKRRREANKKIWEEAAEREAKEMEERVARGEDYDGAELEMLYEKQRQLERATKKGDKKAMREALGAHNVTDASVSGGGEAKSRVVVGGNFDGGDDNEDGDDSDDERGGKGKEQWKCNGCKKGFASDKTFQEHIKSGKHKTKFKQLEKQGVDVAALLVTPNGGGAAAGASPEEASAAAANTDKPAPADKKKDNKGKSKDNHGDDDDNDVVTKKGKQQQAAAVADSDDDDDGDRRKKGGKKGGKAAPPQQPAATTSKKDAGKKKHNKNASSDDEDDAPSTMKPSQKYQKSKVKAAAAAAAAAQEESDEESSEEEVVVTKNKFAFGKKKK